MQESGKSVFGEGYSYGNLEPEDLRKVQQLEEQLGAKGQQKIVLIAYQSKV
jgi:hypothetical protein